MSLVASWTDTGNSCVTHMPTKRIKYISVSTHTACVCIYLPLNAFVRHVLLSVFYVLCAHERTLMQ